MIITKNRIEFSSDDYLEAHEKGITWVGLKSHELRSITSNVEREMGLTFTPSQTIEFLGEALTNILESEKKRIIENKKAMKV